MASFKSANAYAQRERDISNLKLLISLIEGPSRKDSVNVNLYLNSLNLRVLSLSEHRRLVRMKKSVNISSNGTKCVAALLSPAVGYLSFPAVLSFFVLHFKIHPTCPPPVFLRNRSKPTLCPRPAIICVSSFAFPVKCPFLVQ